MGTEEDGAASTAYTALLAFVAFILIAGSSVFREAFENYFIDAAGYLAAIAP